MEKPYGKALINEAFNTGLLVGESATLNYSLDYYNNYKYPWLTLTYQLSKNPYTLTGNAGKKAKAAWHNGFLSGVNG